MTRSRSRRMKAAVALVAIAAQFGMLVTPASAFCGFYVAKADAKLFNKASKVVLTWDDGKAAVTMASDYEGDPKEFALVIPVPTFIAKPDQCGRHEHDRPPRRFHRAATRRVLRSRSMRRTTL
jgi:hypothetical protein